MGIKKRMWPATPSTALPRICRGPLREVVHIESSTTRREGGVKWSLDLSCGHVATRYGQNPRWRAPQMKPLQSAPRRCRCITCGILKKR